MRTPGTRFRRWTGLAITVLIVGGAVATFGRWWPIASGWVHSAIARQRTTAALDEHGHAASEPAHDEHAGHDDHAGHDAANSLELSAQAQGNLGLTEASFRPIALETFHRTLTVPGIVTELPGRTLMEVSTPMAGVVTKVFAVKGEAVEAGSLLFEIRITAEELVSSQTELLKTVGDLDVENKEIARLTKVTESDAIPRKTLLERQYAKEKLENLLLAQREALRLHGLSDAQINEIVNQRRLFRDLKIVAPTPGGASREIQLSGTEVVQASYVEQEAVQKGTRATTELIITEMPVHVGQTVAAGATLAELADYSELFIEGRTFERDVKTLSRVTANGWKVTALFEGAEQDRETVTDLELAYAATAIHVESRTLPFYVKLPNEMVRRVASPNGHAYVEWRHRPGRRVQLLVPIEELKNQIVLPVEAIAKEGAETYVFQQNGGHFDRISVRVRYRDSSHVVIANDGSLFPGDVVARTGAHQMLMALKNKSGGGVDPHAGHNH
jgi:cobalt-zinc-cadmium efflux system membrane fusion protein